MRKKKCPVLLLLLMAIVPSFLSTSSCKKTVTHTIIDTFRHAWQPVTYFNFYGEPALNSVSAGDTALLVATNGGVVSLPVTHQSFDYFFKLPFPAITLDHPASGPPFINGRLCVYATDSLLQLFNVAGYNSLSVLTYKPVYSDDAYPRFQTAHTPAWDRWPTSDFPVIRSHYLLTPVEDAHDRSTVRFDLLTFDSAKALSPTSFGDTFGIKHLFLHPAPGTLGFSGSAYLCATFFDKFFVFYENQFFRIDTTGDIKAFGYTPAPYSQGLFINNMFTYGNILFVKGFGVFFYSLDQGESWQLYNEFNNSVGILTFRNIGNDLYATATTLDMQIWKVALNQRNLVFSELNNDGLQGNLVTSITRCGKYVFATTPTGVYHRDTAVFDQLKNPVR
ncbi:hypothetical protein Q4E93_33155 [Flavitalea sp. BT771]|uniref:hypothetical protein n=1 Tax=Flavitalea sp. BT771 TaxID=3063329 RepID=UPI0026E397A9|nr:hypothetical protein [Flavitalea sp. BT771]MDO6435510.1 hypothetical protein [Flavitalea sp. BT771]MDV6224410.1 hypothetical protein [Flavitalea sp. BT771]